MFEKDFESMLRQYGDAIDDKKRFTALIKDFFPQQVKEGNLMLMAYDIGIVQQIQTAGKINDAFAYRFVKQLSDLYGLSRINADWVVSVWCVCYGKNILGKECMLRISDSRKPVIAAEEGTSGKKYGDLFRYKSSSKGNGLVVYGFSGDQKHTVIFQNQSNGKPVIEVGASLFQGDTIEEAIITDGYQYIGENAFSENSKLHQVVMPCSLIEIGDHAFAQCTALRHVNLPDHLERIGDAAFYKTGLKTIAFPNSVYFVGEMAFAACVDLDGIFIPSGIDKIPNGMFQECINLKKITLSEGLSEIGECAFAGCQELDILTVPDSVEQIGKDAFAGTHKMFIIQCSFGSAAEQYARANKLKYQLI